jgi:hypothetical protein
LTNLLRFLSWVRSELPSTDGVAARGIGIGALLVSLSLTVAPGVVPPTGGDSLLSPIAGVVPVSSIAAVIGLGGVTIALRRRFSASEPAGRGLEVSLPDYVRYDSDGTTDTAGASIDDALEALEESHATPSDVSFLQTKASIGASLRDTAIDVLVAVHGIDEEVAEHLLATGQWTNDPRAAALLGDADVELPLRIRVRDWVRGVPLRRQVEATVEEILAVHESGSTRRSPGDRDGIGALAGVGVPDGNTGTDGLGRTRGTNGFADGNNLETDLAAEIRAVETALNEEAETDRRSERGPTRPPEESLALAGQED